MEKITAEIVTVTSIKGIEVNYSGSNYYRGGHIMDFPNPVKVGNTYLLLCDWIHSPILLPNPYEERKENQ